MIKGRRKGVLNILAFSVRPEIVNIFTASIFCALQRTEDVYGNCQRFEEVISR